MKIIIFLLIFLLDLLTMITVLLWIDIKILQRLSTSASTAKLETSLSYYVTLLFAIEPFATIPRAKKSI